MRHIRAEGARISEIREIGNALGPDVGRSMHLGTEYVIRHREVDVLARGARIQVIVGQVSLLYGQIKSSNSDLCSAEASPINAECDQLCLYSSGYLDS